MINQDNGPVDDRTSQEPASKPSSAEGVNLADANISSPVPRGGNTHSSGSWMTSTSLSLDDLTSESLPDIEATQRTLTGAFPLGQIDPERMKVLIQKIDEIERNPKFQRQAQAIEKQLKAEMSGSSEETSPGLLERMKSGFSSFLQRFQK